MLILCYKRKKKRKKYCIVLIFIPVYFREKLHFVPGISVRFNEVSALCVSALCVTAL